MIQTIGCSLWHHGIIWQFHSWCVHSSKGTGLNAWLALYLLRWCFRIRRKYLLWFPPGFCALGAKMKRLLSAGAVKRYGSPRKGPFILKEPKHMRSHIRASTESLLWAFSLQRFLHKYASLHVLCRTWRMYGCVRPWQQDGLFTHLWRSCFIAWLRKRAAGRRRHSMFGGPYSALRKYSHHQYAPFFIFYKENVKRGVHSGSTPRIGSLGSHSFLQVSTSYTYQATFFFGKQLKLSRIRARVSVKSSFQALLKILNWI